MQISYLKGDATQPVGEGNKIIAHICNDVGGWGKGFVLAISKKWKEPAKQYKNWYKSQEDFALGKVQFVQVEDDVWIANIIGQRDIRPNRDKEPPIRYSAVEMGMLEIAKFAKETNASVHMPRIGCGLAGGKWESIEPILNHELVSSGIDTYVYDFE